MSRHARPKRQIQWFSRFCTAHGRNSLYTMGAPFLQNCPFPPGIWTPWDHPNPQPKQHFYRFSRLCTDDRRMSLYFTMGCPFCPKNLPLPMGDRSGPPSNTWFLNQVASCVPSGGGGRAASPSKAWFRVKIKLFQRISYPSGLHRSPSYFFYFRRGSIIKWNKIILKNFKMFQCFILIWNHVWNEIKMF